MAYSKYSLLYKILHPCEYRKRRKMADTADTEQFDIAMTNLKMSLGQTADTEKRIDITNYMLKLIKTDLQAEFFSTVIYSDYKHHLLRNISHLLPLYFYDNNGTKISTYDLCNANDKRVSVDLANDCIFALPWNVNRLFENYINLKNKDFVFHPKNHLAYYIKQFDLCYVYNGNHSIAAGVYHRKGTIEAEYCDISPLFTHVDTDGSAWYNKHTREKISELFDFRYGLLFEIARIKDELLNNLDKTTETKPL